MCCTHKFAQLARAIRNLNFEVFSEKSKVSEFPNSAYSKKQMDLRLIGLETPLLHALHQMLDPSTEAPNNKSANANKRAYARDADSMAATPADVIERLGSYVFQIDVPGLKSGDIKVEVEDDNVLVISGDRKAEDEKEGFKYVRKERRIGKLMRKFVLPENANTNMITAVCQAGVLSVTVEKLAPPKPKKPRTIEVKIA